MLFGSQKNPKIYEKCRCSSFQKLFNFQMNSTRPLHQFAFIVLFSTCLQVLHDFIYSGTKSAEIQYNVQHFELLNFRTLNATDQAFIQQIQQTVFEPTRFLLSNAQCLLIVQCSFYKKNQCCGVKDYKDFGYSPQNGKIARILVSKCITEFHHS